MPATRDRRPATSPGIGADTRITAEITWALTQFATITKVITLNRDGDCFGDLSGLNRESLPAVASRHERWPWSGGAAALADRRPACQRCCRIGGIAALTPPVTWTVCYS